MMPKWMFLFAGLFLMLISQGESNDHLLEKTFELPKKCSDIHHRGTDESWILNSHFFTPFADEIEAKELFSLKKKDVKMSGKNTLCFKVEVQLGPIPQFWLPYTCKYDKIEEQNCIMDTGIIDPKTMSKFPGKLIIQYMLSMPGKFALASACLEGTKPYYYMLSKTEKMHPDGEAMAKLYPHLKATPSTATSYKAGRVFFDDCTNPLITNLALGNKGDKGKGNNGKDKD